MKEVLITVTDNYEVPDLSNIEPEEWEIAIQSVVDLTSLRPFAADGATHKSQISKKLQDADKKKIAALMSQIAICNKTNEELNNKVRTMEEDHKKSIAERITELNKRLTDEIKVSYEEEKKKYLQRHKDELNETIADLKKTNDRLAKKYEEEKQSALDDAIKRHQKQLQTYQDEIKDYEKQIQINKEKAESIKQLYETSKNQIIEATRQSYEAAKQQAVEAAKQQTINEYELTYERKINERIQSIELTYETRINDYKQSIKTIKESIETSYSKRVDSLEQTINILRDTNNKLNDQLIEQKDSIKNNIETLSTSVLEMSKPLLKFYNGSNEEKGTSGEEFIEQLLLCDRYTGATISDVSGTSASGDRYFKYNQLRCLIEVKNKQKITLDDIAKFERDIKEKAETNSINCAIFVSLHTDVYPGKPKHIMHLEAVHNIPVIYTHVYEPRMLDFSIACLEKIIATNMSKSTAMDVLIKHVREYYDAINNSIKLIKKLIRSRELEIKALARQLVYYNGKLENIQSDQSVLTNVLCLDYPSNSNDPNSADDNLNGDNNGDNTYDNNDDTCDNDNDGAEDKSSYATNSVNNSVKKTVTNSVKRQAKKNAIVIDAANYSKARNIIAQFCIDTLEQKKSVTCKDILDTYNITIEDINRLGGFQKILEWARTSFIKLIITRDVIHNINTYKLTNGKYPSRAALVPAIIPARKLDRISKVFGGRPLDAVINYCKLHLDIDTADAADTADTTNNSEDDAEEDE